MQTIQAVLVTVLLALAVKQLSYALMQGSWFEPLRRRIRTEMRAGRPGFTTLSELFTCKLCMTMQTSLWFVMIPSFGIAINAGIVHTILETGVWASAMITFLACFLYAIGVSGIALGLWIYLEYPAKRYEDIVLELNEARETIADLQAALEIDQPAT